MPVEWKKQDPAPRYGMAAMEARLGKFVVGTAQWNSLTRGEPPYQATLCLPGYKAALGRFQTEAEAMARVEGAVASWLTAAGLAAVEQAANKP